MRARTLRPTGSSPPRRTACQATQSSPRASAGAHVLAHRSRPRAGAHAAGSARSAPRAGDTSATAGTNTTRWQRVQPRVSAPPDFGALPPPRPRSVSGTQNAGTCHKGTDILMPGACNWPYEPGNAQCGCVPARFGRSSAAAVGAGCRARRARPRCGRGRCEAQRLAASSVLGAPLGAAPPPAAGAAAAHGAQRAVHSQVLRRGRHHARPASRVAAAACSWGCACARCSGGRRRRACVSWRRLWPRWSDASSRAHARGPHSASGQLGPAPGGLSGARSAAESSRAAFVDGGASVAASAAMPWPPPLPLRHPLPAARPGCRADAAAEVSALASWSGHDGSPRAAAA